MKALSKARIVDSDLRCHDLTDGLPKWMSFSETRLTVLGNRTNPSVCRSRSAAPPMSALSIAMFSRNAASHGLRNAPHVMSDGRLTAPNCSSPPAIVPKCTAELHNWNVVFVRSP